MPDHLLTTSVEERDHAINIDGYTDESVACYVATDAVGGSIPLYRLWLRYTGNHFYTIGRAERDDAINVDGYADENIACYLFGDADCCTWARPASTALQRRYERAPLHDQR